MSKKDKPIAEMFSNCLRNNGTKDNLSDPLKAAIAFTICTTLQKGILILSTPIFTRLLTTEEYGYYTLFTSWQRILSVFSTLTLTGSIISQAIVKNEDDRDGFVAAMVGLGTTTSVICLLLYIPFSHLVDNLTGMNTVMMVCIFISSWASMCFSIWALKQKVEYKYKKLIQVTLFTSILKPVAGIIAILLLPHDHAEATVASMTAVEVLMYTCIFIWIQRKGKFFHKNYWIYALKLSIPLIPHYLTRMLLNQSDRVMINAMVSTSAAGIYGLAHSLAFLMTVFNEAVLGAFSPWFFSCLKKRSLDKVGSVVYGLLLISAGVNFVVITLAPEVIHVFAPAAYYEAIWVVPPLSMSIFFLFVYSIFADIEYYFERSDFLSIASVIGGITNIVLNYVFIKKFGYLAAGYTTLFCYILYAVLHYRFSKRLLDKNEGNIKPYDIRVIALISLVFVAMSGIAMAFYEIPLIRLSLLFAIVCLFILYKNRIFGLLKEMK